MKIAVVGNCQAGQIAECISILASVEAVRLAPKDIISVESLLAGFDLVLMQNADRFPERIEAVKASENAIVYPRIVFSAFHPDVLHDPDLTSPISGGWLANVASSLALFGWANKLSVEATVSLFTDETFSRLAYLDRWDDDYEALMQESEATEIPIPRAMFSRWASKGCFMWMPVHPKGFVLADIARAAMRRLGIPFSDRPDDKLPDLSASAGQWAVYPPVARHLGIAESGFLGAVRGQDIPRRRFSIAEFIHASFQIFERRGLHPAGFPQITTPGFMSLLSREPPQHREPGRRTRHDYQVVCDEEAIDPG